MVRSIQRYWIAGLISMVLLMNGFIVYNALKERNEFEQLNKKQQTQLFSLKSKIEKLENEKPTQPQSSIQLIKSKILIAIKTGGIKGKGRRMKARETWIQGLSPETKYFFAISNQTEENRIADIERENSVYNDIVEFKNTPEGYNQMTYKLFEILAYSYNHFKFDHLLIVDDDCLLNSLLLNHYSSYWKKEKYFAGNVVLAGPVVRNPTLRNFEPNYNDAPVYPPYVSGATTVLSFDLVEWVARSSLPLRFIRSDDAALGIWLAAVNDIFLDQLPVILEEFFDFEHFSRTPLSYFCLMDISKKDMQVYWDILSNHFQNETLFQRWKNTTLLPPTTPPRQKLKQ